MKKNNFSDFDSKQLGSHLEVEKNTWKFTTKTWRNPQSTGRARLNIHTKIIQFSFELTISQITVGFVKFRTYWNFQSCLICFILK